MLFFTRNRPFTHLALFCLLLSSPLAGTDVEPKNSQLQKSQLLKTKATAENGSKVTSSQMPTQLEKPLPVGVSLHLIKVYKISEATGSFDAKIDLVLKWHDQALSFDPKLHGTDHLIFKMDEATKKLNGIWNPKIVISNLHDNPNILESSLKISSQGFVTFTQRIKGTFQTHFSLISFPFDSHKLTIMLRSSLYNNMLVEFKQSQKESDQSGISEDALPDGWTFKYIDFSGENIKGLEGYFYNTFSANINIKRVPTGHLFAISPLLLIIFVPTILTLYSSIDIVPRLGAWSGALLALIAMSFTLNIRYPSLESNSILSEIIGIVASYEFIMILITMTIFNPSFSLCKRYTYLIDELKVIFRWAIPCLLILLILFVTLITSILDVL